MKSSYGRILHQSKFISKLSYSLKLSMTETHQKLNASNRVASSQLSFSRRCALHHSGRTLLRCTWGYGKTWRPDLELIILLRKWQTICLLLYCVSRTIFLPAHVILLGQISYGRHKPCVALPANNYIDPRQENKNLTQGHTLVRIPGGIWGILIQFSFYRPWVEAKVALSFKWHIQY